MATPRFNNGVRLRAPLLILVAALFVTGCATQGQGGSRTRIVPGNPDHGANYLGAANHDPRYAEG